MPDGQEVTAIIVCPTWHFLAGPYQNDPERAECHHANTHAEQRHAWVEQNGRSVSDG